MARTKALYDPRQRLAQQAQLANVPAASGTVGQSAANQLSSREKGLQAIQAARQQMTPVMGKPVGTATPGSVTGQATVDAKGQYTQSYTPGQPAQIAPKNPPVMGKPVGTATPGSVTGQATVDAKGQYTQSYTPGQPAQIAPKNPLGELATVADQMKVDREQGNLGNWLKTFSETYQPLLNQVQTSVGTVDTGQVQRILGAPATPATVAEQQQLASKLAADTQAARERGDWGTANSLAQQLQGVISAMQGQVTGQPSASSGAPAISPEIKQKIDSLGNQLLNPNLTDAQRQEIKRQQQELLASSGYTNPDQISMTKGGPPVSTIPEDGSGEVPAAPSGETTGQVPTQVQAEYDRIDQQVATIDEQIRSLQQVVARQPRTPSGQPSPAATQLQQLQQRKSQLLEERKGAMDQWESTGKYEAQIEQLISTPRPGSQYTINDLPENLKNEAVQEALAAVKAGQDPQAAMDKYLAYFDQNVDFSLKPPGITAPDRTVEGMTKTGGIEIAGPDNVDLSTDKSRIDAALQRSGMTPEGQQALKLQLETIQKRLSEGGGGFSEQELKDMAAPILAANNRAMQADISAMQHDLAASGFESGPILAQKTAEIRQQYAEKNQAAITELVRENMGYKQQGTSEAIAALGGIAESERAGALSEKELALRGATTQTELTSQEKQAQVEAEYRQKALFQEGRLTQQGQLIQQELESYGLNLEKYQTDRGFDEAALDRDLKERLAEQEGSMAAAELKFKQIKEAMDQAGKEVERDDARDALAAELTVKVAQGDQDAKYRMEALNVEKDLRQQGLDNDWAEFLGNLQYQIMSGREENQLKWKMLLTQIDAEIKAQGGGGLTGFLAEVAGVAVGAATGGFGTAAGSYLAGKVLGGK